MDSMIVASATFCMCVWTVKKQLDVSTPYLVNECSIGQDLSMSFSLKSKGQMSKMQGYETCCGHEYACQYDR